MTAEQIRRVMKKKWRDADFERNKAARLKWRR